LVFYFLGFLFKFLPLGFTSFCLADTFLFILQYAALFFITRQLFPNRMAALASFFSILLVDHFYQKDYATWFPSSGPLRFGFIYVLMSLVLLRGRRPHWAKVLGLAESMVAAIAFLWSFEVCFYTVPAYLGLVFYESTVDRDGDWTVDLGAVSRRVLTLLGMVLALLGCLYLDILWTSHEPPHWSRYFDYIFLYQGGWGMLPLPPMGYWWAVAGTLYGSFFALLALGPYRPARPFPFHLNAIALLTFYGIFQFFYYLGRAHWNNLIHIAMPSLLLFLYWLHYLRYQDPPSLPRSLKTVLFWLPACFAAFCLPLGLPTALPKLLDRVTSFPQLGQRTLAAFQDRPRDDGFALQAEALMEKYSGKEKRLVYFFGERGLEISLYTGRSRAYPYNDVIQADDSPQVRRELLTMPPPLKSGDVIYLSRDIEGVYNPLDNGEVHIVLEQGLLRNIVDRYRLEFLEEKGGIGAYRVLPLGKKSGLSPS
jgi:hypothetical protein